MIAVGSENMLRYAIAQTSIRLSCGLLQVEMTVDSNLLCHIDENEFSVCILFVKYLAEVTVHSSSMAQ